MAKTSSGDKLSVSIPWPFAPKTVRCNTDTSLLKIVAMITMLIDHAGKMLFPQYFIMRIIGRIAFPIYAYCMATGCVFTKKPARYLSRLVLLALVTQPLYSVAMGYATNAMMSLPFAEHPLSSAWQFYVASWGHPSILLALSLGMILIWTLREKRISLALGVFLLCWIIQNKLDYGIKGILLMLLFYVFCGHPLISFPAVAAYMIWWGTIAGSRYSLFGITFGVQMFAIFALPLIYIPMHTGLKIPKWVFYLYYPAHLLLILLLDTYVI